MNDDVMKGGAGCSVMGWDMLQRYAAGYWLGDGIPDEKKLAEVDGEGKE